MDMTQSIEPRSDQINADDLIAGRMTVTVREVIVGKAEHPFDFLLVETDRAYRPSKTMRRVIVGAWGPDAANYAGRRLTLYREPSITFGGQKVGGIRISAMSHISGPVEVMAQTTRGKREKFIVQPLASSTPSTTGGDPPSATRVRPDEVAASPGMDTNGGSATEAAEPPTVPLWQAVEQQMDSLSSHDAARLHRYCRANDINPTRDGFIEAWGEGARDLMAAVDAAESAGEAAS